MFIKFYYPILYKDFQERYPNGEKMIHYKRAIVENFAPYKKKNGLMQRLTTYETLDYKEPKMRWEWYANRKDLLQMIKIDFNTKQLEECFVKGRPDCLKCINIVFFLYIYYNIYKYFVSQNRLHL